MIGCAEVDAGGRGDAAVHPAWHARGVGSALAAWMQTRGREQGASEVGMPVVQGSPGDRLLEALGYRVGYTSWLLSLPEGVEVPARTLPSGYAIRDAAEPDLPVVHQVLEDAFLEWARREREPFEDFLAETVQRQGFQPWNIRLVSTPDDQIVAAVIVLMSLDGAQAFVPRVATRGDQRGRGLAQALLVDAFGLGRRHGATSFSLSTDSRTGALDLYRKVGMVVDSVWLLRTIAV
jgi:GNAT superfamily N-acetyltransferase